MYRLGLDIGITSVGWAVLATDENAEPYRIIDLGSRTRFEIEFSPKEKPSADGMNEVRFLFSANKNEASAIGKTNAECFHQFLNKQ